jgi:hypothetical protein
MTESLARVEFYIADLDEEQQVVGTTISHVGGWRWNITDADVQVIHGIHLTASILPDKLATSKLIIFHDHDDSLGRFFLLELMKGLVQTYMKIHEENSEERLLATQNVFETRPDEGNLSIRDALDVILRGLDELQAAADQGEAAFDTAARSLLQSIGIFDKMCLIYLKYVHPMTIETLRDKNFDEEKAEELWLDCTTLLQKGQQDLTQKFNRLTTKVLL